MTYQNTSAERPKSATASMLLRFLRNKPFFFASDERMDNIAKRKRHKTRAETKRKGMQTPSKYDAHWVAAPDILPGFSKSKPERRRELSPVNSNTFELKSDTAQRDIISSPIPGPQVPTVWQQRIKGAISTVISKRTLEAETWRPFQHMGSW